MKRMFSGIILAFLLIGLLPLTFNVQLSKSEKAVSTEVSALGSFWTGADWNKTYGGTYTDYANSVVQTSDGGYTIVGYTNSSGAGNQDIWLVKTDSAGNAQWNKTYGGTNRDEAYSVVQTNDGGYAIAGFTRSFGVGGDFWLVKTDSSGNMQWNRTYGGASWDWAYSLVQTGDGGYALAGYTNSYGSGSYDVLLVKTDATGNLQWNKTYGGTSWDIAYFIVKTGDGGYALAGYTNSSGAGNADMWLVKTDSSGNMQWNNTYGGANYDSAIALVQTTGGGYAMTGFTSSFGVGGDFWLVKTDSSGNALWNRTFGGPSIDGANAIVQTADGGYAVAGNTNSSGAGNRDLWLVRTDSAGNTQWNKTCGGTNNDYARCMVQTTDGGYAVAGSTYSFGAGDSDFWLVKLMPNTIYIHADGSVDPSTAPIQRNGDRYTLTDDIHTEADGIVVERDNMTLDGAGYTLQGSGSNIGIYLSGRNNVTLKNMKINAFNSGIWLSFSSNNSIFENDITNNYDGVYLSSYSYYNSIVENNMTNNIEAGIFLSTNSSHNEIRANGILENAWFGVLLLMSSDNTLRDNDITNNNYTGIQLQDGSSNNRILTNFITVNHNHGLAINYSHFNEVVGNCFTENGGYGAGFFVASSNTIHHNNFERNTGQAYSDNSPNLWDNGYPSGGNYWSNYNGTDTFRGLSQNVSGSDGIGDTPFVISVQPLNVDWYPLKGPVGSSTKTGENVTVFPTDDVCLIFEEITADGSTTVMKSGTGPDPPPSYTINQYYDIQTTAEYSGTIRIRIAYDDSSMTEEEEADLKLIQHITILGDLDGDYDVDLFDAVKLLVRYGARESEPDYDPDCDIDKDGRIFLYDAVILCTHYGQELGPSERWQDITLQIDTENNLIFAETTHLSIFGVTRG